MNKIFLMFFGPPGSGKGTQADMLGAKMKLPVISPGELLRFEEKMKATMSKKVAILLKKGKMVPDEIVEKIIDKRLKEKDVKKGFIVDGYPRNKKQLDNLLKRFKSMAGAKDLIFAVLINASAKEIRRRLGGRRVCICGASYHMEFNPPKRKNVCDLCGKKIYRRDDDKPAVISARIKLYERENAPLINYWRRQGKLIEINGERSIKKVQREILIKLKMKTKNKKLQHMNARE